MDPNSTHTGPSRHGGLAPNTHAAELGTVVAADPRRMSYTVRTSRGRNLPGVPRIRYAPSDLTVLPIGTTVVMRYDLGLPTIDGVLTLPATPATDTGIPVTGVEGSSQLTTDYSTGGYRAPGEPADLYPGDTVSANQSGAAVGILEGAVALLKGSNAAQLRAFGLNDLVEIISRNFRHVTDMGIWEVKNRDGRVNLSFRGASDQRNESGATEENWTIRFDLGSEGDLFDFRLTTPQGQTLFRFHVDSDGRCEIFGADGVVTQSGNRNGEPHIEEHGGDSRSLVHGSRVVTTEGDTTTTVSGSSTTTVDGNATHLAGRDSSMAAVNDIGIAAGRNMSISATGARQGDDALRVVVQGGDYATEVGQTSYPTAEYKLSTLRGNIAFRSSMGGNFTVESLTGNLHAKTKKAILETLENDSVVLGGHALVSHVAKYEQLEQLLRALFQLHDTHTHPIPTGGSSGVPVVPMASILAGMLAAIKSIRVGVGG